MTIPERLDESARKIPVWIRTLYMQDAADLRDLLSDAADCIRHLEMVNAEAIRALGDYTGADLLVVPK